MTKNQKHKITLGGDSTALLVTTRMPNGDVSIILNVYRSHPITIGPHGVPKD